MTLEDTLDKVRTLCNRKFTEGDWEVRLTNGKIRQFNMQKGTPQGFSGTMGLLFSVSESPIENIRLRLLSENKTGIAYGHSFTKNIDVVLKNAKRTLELREKKVEGLDGFHTGRNSTTSDFMDKRILDFSEDDAKEMIKHIYDTTIEVDNQAFIVQGGVAYGHIKNVLLNSSGFRVEEEGTRFVIGLVSGFQSRDKFYTGFDSQMSWSLNNMDPHQVAETATDMARSIKSPKKFKEVQTGKVLFSPLASTGILSLIGQATCRQMPDEDASFFKENLDLPSNILIKDEGGNSDGSAPSRFDGEGIEHVTNNIITDNEQNWLTNLEIATEYNFDKSTGNCSEMGGTAPSSLFVQPSKNIPTLALEDIFNEMKDGIYVLTVMADNLTRLDTGDFAITSDMAFHVQKGKARPIKRVMISGTALDLLSSVSAVGEEKTSKVVGMVKTPALLVDNLSFVGN